MTADYSVVKAIRGGNVMLRSSILALSVAAVMSAMPMVPVQAAGACVQSCLSKLRDAGTLRQYPRGYCRSQCNDWKGAPSSALKNFGHSAAAACLETCRTENRAKPGFRQNPANRNYCHNKCGA